MIGFLKALCALACASFLLHASPALADDRPSDGHRQWMVERMASWSPPGKSLFKSAVETPEQGMERYAQIALAILRVSYDPSEQPVFDGRDGRLRTAALVASVLWHESGFRRDVDLNVGPLARGDGGRSWCLAQANLGLPVGGRSPTRIVMPPDGSISYTSDPKVGYGGEDLVSDREACVRFALRRIRLSFSACRSLPIQDRVSQYTAGRCVRNQAQSRSRVGRATRWLGLPRPEATDDAVATDLWPSSGGGVAALPPGS